MQFPWFLLFSSSSFLADDQQPHHKHSADEAQLKVAIEVECDGIDWDQLGLRALAFSSKALEDTYNDVHETMDGGDVFLVGSRFNHVIYKQKDHPGHILTLSSVSPQVELSSIDVGAGDTTLQKKKTPKPTPVLPNTPGGGGYSGGWGCYLCPPDMLMDTASDMRAWQSAFAAALQASAHKELSKATDCRISLHADSPSTVEGPEKDTFGDELFTLRGTAASAA